MDATTIRALEPGDAEAYRELRLEALAVSPESFGSSFEEEAALSLDEHRARMAGPSPDIVFGAWAGEGLVGMAGFVRARRLKERHKGVLWGVYVRAEWRGRGLAEALVRRVVAHAAEHVALLQAVVVTANAGARRVYLRCGFEPYGIERRALCVDGVFYDEELIALDFATR